jgi:hypothetical protein
MSQKKISDLPKSYAREVAAEAQKKGFEALGSNGRYFDVNAVHFIGLCQIIHELRERIEKLEHTNA